MSEMLMKIGGLSSKTAAIHCRTIETEGCGTIVLQATNVYKSCNPNARRIL